MAVYGTRATVGKTLTGAPDDEHEEVEYVVAHVCEFEDSIGKDFHDRCNGFYRQYRGFQQFKNAWEKAGPNDRDGVMYDAKKTWGSNLHIPLSFRTIETMVPRAIAQRPRMLYLPRKERWEDNVENVRMMLDAQQEQIDIELRWQDVMRQGMMYGLGVGKSFWRKEFAAKQRMQPRMLRLGSFKLGRPKLETTFDDPDFEDIDIFDFGWDMYGSDLNHGSSRCRWVYHRLWMGLDQVLERVDQGLWNTASAQLLDEDKVRGMSTGKTKYDDVWNERMEASGLPSFQRANRGEQPHEVIEFHDGHTITTVLDRSVLVGQYDSPCPGMLPFHAYRPTRVAKQLIGISEIEPVQHLQRELDILRSQRRDAATIALCAGYAYDTAAVDKDAIVFGPASLIPVTNASPGDAILPLQVRDVPGSAFENEQVIKQDWDAVTGIADQLVPSDGSPAGTATEAQLVQAAVSMRVELKSRGFEVEVVRSAARCWLEMDQRMISGSRDIRRPADGVSAEDAMAEGKWTWVTLGPGQIMGDYEIAVEGGTLAAQNVPQMRQDAQALMSLFGNDPTMDGKQVRLKALHLYGIRDPESWLAAQDAPVPPAALQALEKMGVDPQLIQHAVAIGQSQEPLLNQNGPSAAGVGAYMQGGDPKALAA